MQILQSFCFCVYRHDVDVLDIQCSRVRGKCQQIFEKEVKSELGDEYMKTNLTECNRNVSDNGDVQWNGIKTEQSITDYLRTMSASQIIYVYITCQWKIATMADEVNDRHREVINCDRQKYSPSYCRSQRSSQKTFLKYRCVIYRIHLAINF